MVDGEERRWGRKRGGEEICRLRERSLKMRPCASSYVWLGLVEARLFGHVWPQRDRHTSHERWGSSANSVIYLTKLN